MLLNIDEILFENIRYKMLNIGVFRKRMYCAVEVGTMTKAVQTIHRTWVIE